MSEEMHSHGSAWFNSQYSDSADLFETENVARDVLLGWWGLPKPQIVEPWVWRKTSAVERRAIREWLSFVGDPFEGLISALS